MPRIPAIGGSAAMAALTLTEDQAGDARTALWLVEHPEKWLRFDPGESLRGILLSTLRETFVPLQVLLGSDTAMWEWGNLHHALPAHPLSPLVDAERRGRWNVGPVPRGGSGGG